MGPAGPIPSMEGVHKALLAWAEEVCTMKEKRLAVVRELVENCALEGMWAKTCRDMAIESLRAVWPEAVEE